MAVCKKKRSILLSLRSVTNSLLALLVLTASLRAEEEIRVELTTRVQLSPLYLSTIQGDNASLDTGYLSKIRRILEFDLSHSGYSKVASTDENLEKIVRHYDPQIAFNPQKWEKVGVAHVLKGVVNEKKLDFYAYNIQTGALKKFEGIPLSGVMNMDRRQIHKLSDALLKTLFDVDGVCSSRILYSVQGENIDPSTKSWKAEIWECDWDGRNAKQVTFEEDYCISPVFIPYHSSYGNDRFVYVNYKNGQPKIHFSSIKNRTGKPLINLRGNQLLPAVSPKKNLIAFISDASGRADLFTQKINLTGNLEGKPQQLFSYPQSTQASPTFHPDGSKIAFVSDKDGTPRIYEIPSEVIENKRATPKLLTKCNRENTCPSWSPDGTKIAYSAKTNGVRQIWIYDTATGEEQQLTSGTGNKENPSWAHDSLHLVFNSTDPDTSELYIVNLNQPQAVKISSGPSKKHYPTWGI